MRASNMALNDDVITIFIPVSHHNQQLVMWDDWMCSTSRKSGDVSVKTL
jgi:hypothetical protein